MAGIGFVLRKLLKKDSLSGIVQAYMHAVVASSGPWIFTVLTLGFFFLVSDSYSVDGFASTFRAIIIYNFFLSLVISHPITIVATRYLSDLIYKENVDDAPGLLLGSMFLLFLFTAPLISFFYFFVIKMDLALTILSILNFELILGIWLSSIFISALKQYLSITFSFVGGLVVAVCSVIIFAKYYDVVAMMASFNLGLGFIFSSIIALIFAEYPKKSANLFRIVTYLGKYWDLALGGFFYGLGIWVDKWIMWFSNEAIKLPNGMIMYPHYDSAMFIGCLTVIPVIAMFLISQETSFFEYYITFFKDIQKHVNLEKIEKNHKNLVSCFFSNCRNILLLQLIVTSYVLLAAPSIFKLLDINYIGLGIFRFATLGASFQVLALFLTITLSYFDARRPVMWIQLYFFLSNALFTYFFRDLGYAFYGAGFFLSSLTTFFIAALWVISFLKNLPYVAFVVNNTAIRK